MLMRHRSAHQNATRGYTLIELMITVTLIAIFLIIAVPNFTTLLVSNRLSNTANDVVSAINLARLEAIKRNTPTQFCSNVAALNGTDTLGAICGTSASSVYTIDSSNNTTRIFSPPQTSTTIALTTSSNVTAIRFAGNGIASIATGTAPYTGLVADVYSSAVTTKNHRCIYLTTGSVISSCQVTGAAGTCPALEPASCQQ